jgi:predicted amidohydrolase
VKIAVVQHKLRGEPYEDAEALVGSARAAHEQGAEFVFFPEVDSLGEDHGGPRAEFLAGLRELEINTLAPNPAGREDGEDVALVELGPLGRAALLSGDAPVDPEVHRNLLDLKPEIIVMLGRSESDLQAEALLEVAIGLSDSATGLVIVVDAAGAEPGEPGHGGSAVAVLGEVVGEAIGDDEIVLVELDVPVSAPQPRESLPEVAPILLQRLAHHRGEKPAANYPAEDT